MTINTKRLLLPSLLVLFILLPTALMAGGKKETQEQPAEQQTEAPQKERTPIEIGDNTDAAAVVNGTVIGLERYERQVQAVQQQYLMQGIRIPEEQLDELKGQVLESLIDQELLAQEAKKAGYEADPAQVEQQLEQIKGQFPSQEQYLQAMAQQGVTEQSVVAELEKALVVQNFISDRFASEVTVTEADTRGYYDSNPQYFIQPEQVRASHILFSVAPDAPDDEVEAARQKAEAALSRYRDGEEFSDLARELSEGPSGPDGGDLGFFGRSQMVKPFEDAAFAMEVGAVSDPVRTDFGFHLIRLTARNEEQTVDYQQVMGQISDHLYKLKLGELVKAFLDDRKAESSISRLVEVPVP